MLFSKTNFLFITSSVLFSLIFIHGVSAADPLFHFCFSNRSFTPNSTFATNLKQLLIYLPDHVPPTGFGASTSGQCGCDNSQAHGLGLCRGDVSTEDCNTCIAEASKEIQRRCPDNKGAIVWYDNCLLKYSDEYFFGQIDDQNKFSLWNGYDAENPELFRQKLKELVHDLSNKASESPKLYATGEIAVGSGPDPNLYGSVQCTRDLDPMTCKKCLDDAITQLPDWITKQKGARAYSGSCLIRYEVYRFY